MLSAGGVWSARVKESVPNGYGRSLIGPTSAKSPSAVQLASASAAGARHAVELARHRHRLSVEMMAARLEDARRPRRRSGGTQTVHFAPISP